MKVPENLSNAIWLQVVQFYSLGGSRNIHELKKARK